MTLSPADSSVRVTVILSLGSSLSPRRATLAAARCALNQLPETRILKESSVIETDPVGAPPEFADCKYLNQVVSVETSLEAHDFSRRIHAIETALGRVRGLVRNVPRTIDIDIITFGTLVLNEPELTVPHPRARMRRFVLEPLAEIEPAFVWPN